MREHRARGRNDGLGRKKINGRLTKKTIVQAADLVKQQLKEGHLAAALLRPCMFPMIVPPRNWTMALDGGYLTDGLRRSAVKRAEPQYIRGLDNMMITNTVYAAM